MAKRKKKGKAPVPKKEQRTWTPAYIIVAALLAAVMVVSVITPFLYALPISVEDDHTHNTVPYFVDGQWYVYNEDHGHFEEYPGTEDMAPYEEDGTWYVYDAEHGHYHPTTEAEGINVPYFEDGYWFVYNEDHGHMEQVPGVEEWPPYLEDKVWHVYDVETGEYLVAEDH